jgi:hypothetical protein
MPKKTEFGRQPSMIIRYWFQCSKCLGRKCGTVKDILTYGSPVCTERTCGRYLIGMKPLRTGAKVEL